MALQLNGTDGVTFNDGSEQWAAASPIGTKNLIINGDMRIDQRYGGATTGWGQGIFGIDRFRCRSDATITASNVTYEQSTDVPSGQGFSKSMQLNCILADTSLATDARYSIEHRIEGNNFSHLEFGTANAKTFTLSFWVKSNVTGTYSLTFANGDGSNFRTYMTAYTISSANTWEKKIITVDGDTSGNWYTDNGIGLSMQMMLVAGSDYLTSSYDWSASTPNVDIYNSNTSQVNFVSSTDNYFRLTGVQLEVGDTATPFEVVPYDVSLARCQRYYSTSIELGYTITDFPAFGAGRPGATFFCSVASGNDLFGNLQLPVAMRTAPTFNIYSAAYRTSGHVRDGATGANVSVANYSFSTGNNKSIVYMSGLSGTVSRPYNFHWTAEAEL